MKRFTYSWFSVAAIFTLFCSFLAHPKDVIWIDHGQIELETPIRVRPFQKTTPFTYRVESFGNTEIEVEYEFPISASVVILGPIEDETGKLPPIKQFKEVIVNEYETITLEKPGAYLLGFKNPKRSPLPSITVRCLTACNREELKPQEFLQETKKNGEFDAIVAMVKHQISVYIKSDVLKKRLISEFDQIIKNGEKDGFKGVERFPAIPIDNLDEAQALLGQTAGMGDGSVPVSEKKDYGDLMKWISDCKAARPAPKMIKPEMPSLQEGHFANLSLSDCELSNSKKLAEVFNALARNDGSSVMYGEVKHTDSITLLEALNQSRSLEVRQERTYANFFSLVYRGKNVAWPGWINTKINVGDTGDLTVPVFHSHHVFRFKNPFPARVMFYMGVSGVGFFPQVDLRPAWTGFRTEYTLHSSDDSNQAKIRELLRLSNIYYRLIREKGKDLKNQGYGILGVCDDSTALMQVALKQKAEKPYPLVSIWNSDKDLSFDGEFAELVPFFKQLPSDPKIATRKSSHRGILKRVLAMNPFTDLEPGTLFDQKLSDQLKAAEKEVQK